MNRRNLILLATAAATATAFSSPAVWAQDAGQPIRLIVPYAPGGPIDVTARALAERVRESLGTVIIDNKGGAGGNIGADAIAKAAPDGLTIGIAATATHAVNPWLYARMPYDAGKDFAGITQMVRVPNVLVMNAAKAEQLKIHTVTDLIAYAKANPAKLNYGSGGNGSACASAPVRGARRHRQSGRRSAQHPRGQAQGAGRDLARRLGLAARRATAVRDFQGFFHRHLVGPGGAGRHAQAHHRQAEQGFCGGTERARNEDPLCRIAGGARGHHAAAVRQLHGQRACQVPASGEGVRGKSRLTL